ncbi:MAG: hypothetical protein U0174_12755 [Polyangiaceae bacterium]
MKPSSACLALTSFSALAFVAACSGSTPGSTIDGGAAQDANAFEDGSAPPVDGGTSDSAVECQGGTKPVQPGAATTLLGVLGNWKLTKTLDNGKETEAIGCDAKIGYSISIGGASAPTLADTTCVIARGEVMAIQGGRLDNLDGQCSAMSCGPKAGLVWNESSGTVFQLDENGKPKGPGIFSISAVPNKDTTQIELVFSNSGSTKTGDLYTRVGTSPTCTP